MSAGTLTPRGSNKWQAKVERAGRQYTKTIRAKSRRAADKELAAFVTAIDENRVSIAPARLLFSRYLDDWLAALTKRPLTIAGYTSAVRTHIKPQLGAIMLRNLTALDIKRAFAVWQTKLAPSSLKQLRNVLASALTQAEKFDLINLSPMRKLKGELPIGEPPEAAATSADKIAETLRDESPFGIAALLCVAAGLRRGEACGLRWRNVNLETGIVDIVEQLTPLGWGAPKTEDGKRSIRLPAEATERLRAHWRQSAERMLASGRRLTPDHTLVMRPDGRPIDPNDFTRWCKRRDFNPHGLRHAHASHLLAAGVPVNVVSERLGHSTAMTTLKVYAHLLPGQDDAAADVIGERMFRINTVSK